jgi:hypothetical protein
VEVGFNQLVSGIIVARHETTAQGLLLLDGQWLIILDLLEIVVKVFCPALDDVIVFAHDFDV